MRSAFLRRWDKIFSHQPGSLVSPGLDFWLAGGLAVAVYALFIASSDSLFSSRDSLLWLMYYLGFLVNYPHFTASYELIYRDLRGFFWNDTTNKKFTVRLWWAGFVVPLLLLTYFSFALAAESRLYMGYLVNAMYFFVGWHYVKQIFGCVIVLSSARSLYYGKAERYAILATLYLLWGVAYVSNNLYFGINDFFGITFSSVAIPEQFYSYLNGALLLSLAVLAVLLAQKFFLVKTLPPASAVVAYLAIFLWLHPVFAEPYYFMLIPFFHSLQYLLFVYAYKRNQAAASLLENEYQDEASKVKLFGATVLAVFFILTPAMFLSFYMLKLFTSELAIVAFWASKSIPFVTVQGIESALLLGVVIGFWCVMAHWYRSRYQLSKVVYFFFQIIVLGVFLFTLIPMAFDFMARRDLLPSIFSYDGAIFGSTLYLFLFTIFINIHHYFVDNVIWGRDNPKVRAYLFKKDA